LEPVAYEFGDFRLEIGPRRLYHGRDLIELAEKRWDLVLYLVRNDPRLIPKSELQEHLWPGEEADHLAHIVDLIQQVHRQTGSKFIKRKSYRFGLTEAARPEFDGQRDNPNEFASTPLAFGTQSIGKEQKEKVTESTSAGSEAQGGSGTTPQLSGWRTRLLSPDWILLRKRISTFLTLRSLSLLAIGLLLILAGNLLFKWRERSQNLSHFTIAIAPFEDPSNPELAQYRMTKTVHRSLQNLADAHTEIRVASLGHFIPSEDSKTAPEQAEQIGARMVIWGDYDHTGTNVDVSVRIALVRLPVHLSESPESEIADYADLQAYRLQQKLSENTDALARIVWGIYRFQSKDLVGAISVLDELARDSPPFRSIAFHTEGTLLNGIGSFAAATGKFDQAIQVNPQYTPSYSNRGFSLRRQGRLKEAIADYTTAIHLDPMYALAFMNRGYAYRLRGEDGDHDAALADYNKALMLVPGDLQVLRNRAVLFDLMGQTEESIHDRSEVLRTCSRCPADHSALAKLYLKMGLINLAIDNFTSAISLDPNSQNTVAYLLNRADAYHSEKRDDRALRDINETIMMRPTDARGYAALAHLLFDEGDTKRAIVAMDRFTSLIDSSDPSHLSWLAELEKQRATSNK
jgi:tetratricopeptide (TPR) repeat protein